MLRRKKTKTVKRLADDASDLSVALRHSENETVRMTNSNASLESTVFGGESKITEQLEHIDVATSGFKVNFFIALLSRTKTL